MLGMAHADLIERMRGGGSDDEILEWFIPACGISNEGIESKTGSRLNESRRGSRKGVSRLRLDCYPEKALLPGSSCSRALSEACAHRVCSSAMERSRVATTNSAFLILPKPVSEKIYLTQYGLMAERHWREFRPKMVRELEAKESLTEALFEAQERTINEMEALTRQLETEQKLTPQQAHDQAWEMIREKYILLPPEENVS
jgi:hypothetical protein